VNRIDHTKQQAKHNKKRERENK